MGGGRRVAVVSRLPGLPPDAAARVGRCARRVPWRIAAWTGGGRVAAGDALGERTGASAGRAAAATIAPCRDSEFSHAAAFPQHPSPRYARRLAANGQNAHCTVRPLNWWRGLIDKVAARRPAALSEFRFQLLERGGEDAMVEKGLTNLDRWQAARAQARA